MSCVEAVAIQLRDVRPRGEQDLADLLGEVGPQVAVAHGAVPGHDTSAGAPLARHHAELVNHAQLVALCDTSMTRMKVHSNRIIEKHEHPPVPMYLADKFDQMVKERHLAIVDVLQHDVGHVVPLVSQHSRGGTQVASPLTTGSLIRLHSQASNSSVGTTVIALNRKKVL